MSKDIMKKEYIHPIVKLMRRHVRLELLNFKCNGKDEDIIREIKATEKELSNLIKHIENGARSK